MWESIEPKTCALCRKKYEDINQDINQETVLVIDIITQNNLNTISNVDEQQRQCNTLFCIVSICIFGSIFIALVSVYF
jgi:hypothetical protein